VLVRAARAGTEREDLGEGVRGLPLGNYIAYYREEMDVVTVSRMIHGSREQEVAYFD
jgi:plasmid stabilization system protein ParE